VSNFVEDVKAMIDACGGKGAGMGWQLWVEWSSRFHHDVYADEKVAGGLSTNYGFGKWKVLSKLWTSNKGKWHGE
jgi:hypothetical protein